MVFTYEDITTLIPNTTMQKIYIDEVHKGYRIKPIANYVLHDNTLNVDVFDDMGYEVISSKFGYSPASVYVTCGADYDFSTHTVTDQSGDSYIAYGDRDFYALPEQFDTKDNKF